MTITSITIVRSSQMDMLVLHTDLPASTYPYEGTESVLLFAAKDEGEDYVKKNFPNVPYTIA